MRRAAVILGMLAVVGCGEVEREPALAPVRLELDAPTDLGTVEDDSVEVRGSVVPASARVRVAGSDADVSGGSFSATVALDEGPNVIDVQAGAPRRPAAMAALRVTRVVKVAIPSYEGAAPEDALDSLSDLGLTGEIEPSGGLLDELLPSDPSVCATSPGAGSTVLAGTTVTVFTARSC